ncbi:MAG: exodeoxyribonuclease VII small subunit [Bacteroidota bacterium]
MINLTFDTAYTELERIIRLIESENIPLDELAEKVKEAKTLIRFCEDKLRGIEDELNKTNEIFE